MTREIWKPISGYEGLYEVSNKGQIRSIPRLVHYSAGYDRINKGRVLEPVKASRNKNCDYFRVSLSKNNIVRQFPVHRIVAENFVPRKSGCDFVNHIDGNKHNNAVENLEWVTASGNKMHAVYTGIDIPNFGIKRVYCLTNGKVYPSASQAARELGLDDSSVSKVCRGKREHTKGMVFRYV